MNLRRVAMWIVPALLSSGMSPVMAQGRLEWRGDAILAARSAVHAGGGVLFPIGTYVRSGIVIGAGESETRLSYRAEFMNLFHLDPFRESGRGVYGGGGVSFRHDEAGNRNITVLLALIGVELPLQHGYAPALEAGLGGGVRLAVVMRKARDRTR